MFENQKEIRISLWNAVFAVLFTGAVAAGVEVAQPLLEFMNSEAFSLGDLGTVTWGLIAMIGSLGGAAITNEFNHSEYADYQRVGLGASIVGLASVFMVEQVHTFIASNVWYGVAVLIGGSVIYFVISVADAEGSLMD